ncbi:MAG: transposase, partial [Gammaproteobacteria bacterium]|nr:transposase [Gammaproteobacteria bacterium]
LGTCCFVYNQGVEARQDSTERANIAALRARTKSDEMLAQHPWLADSPEDVRDGALQDLTKAQSVHFAKLRKLRDVDPAARLACKFKFQSKRDSQQSIEIRARDWGRSRGMYSKLFGQGVLKWAEELPKELKATCRLVRDRLGRYYICLVRQVAIRSENQAPKSTHGVVYLDPGVRTFQTCFDADGLIAEWGEADMTKLFQHCYAADRLQKRISNTKGNSTKKHRRRMAWHRLLQKIRNKVNEVHKKLSTWLCENYRVVLLPKFETQQMVRRRHRKPGSKTARGMCTWAHYRFRQTLLSKAELYPWCKVVVCDEHYTSKTCGACGWINPTLCSSKAFKCASCNYTADRDISAARNILLRYLTCEKIGSS